MVPFVPLLVYRKGETNLTDDMRRSLEILKDVFNTDSTINIAIESGAESSLPYRKRIFLADQRAKAVAEQSDSCLQHSGLSH